MDAELQRAGVPPATAEAVEDQYSTARLTGLRASLSVLGAIALVALAFTRGIPTRQPSAASPDPPQA